MATMSNQAETFRTSTGHHYGDINIYGNALLGDGVMNVQSASVDPQEHRRQMLMNSLDYDGAEAKRDQLKLTEIGPASFAWVEDTPLSDWLRHGKSAFWVSGKPGSGKSTLMRYLVDSHSTQELLDSDGNHWQILHFFYDYRAGHGLGNVPYGMLRTFLLQLLRSVPSMAERLDDRRIHQQLSDEDIDTFIDILAELIRSTTTRICAFIDGLDEYDGHLWELCSHLELLRDRTGMKMCLASRPELELVNAFRELPTIVVQEHNDRSIQYYIERSILEQSSSYPNIRIAFSNRLARSLRKRARGVILWAKLVVKEMLEIYEHDTTEDTLSALLDSMPPELGQLYDRLITRLPDAYKGDAVLVLSLVATHRDETTPRLDAVILFEAVSFIVDVQSKSSFFAQRAKPATVESIVKKNLCGLLDFFDLNDGLRNGLAVRLIHETLATHLRRSNYLLDSLPTYARRYCSPTAWARLSLDALHHAVDNSAFDFAILKQAFMERLESRQRILVSGGFEYGPIPLPEGGWSAYTISSEWKTLSRFLENCCEALPAYLRHHPEVARDSFEMTKKVLSSDVGLLLLHIHKIFLKWWGSIEVMGKVQANSFIRLWQTGRLDLAIAAAEGIMPYLCEVMERSQLEARLQDDVFGLVITNNRTYIPAADLLHFVEQSAMRHVQFEGKYVCRIDEIMDSRIALSNIQQVLENLPPGYKWSKAHDPECKFYATSKTLMVHWCESGFDVPKHIHDFRKVILRTEGDGHIEIGNGKTTIEPMFDFALRQWKRQQPRSEHWHTASHLKGKIAALIEHEAQRLSQTDFKTALRCAITLRRRITLAGALPRFMRGEDLTRTVAELDERIIPVLRKLATMDTFSESELWKLPRELYENDMMMDL